jgi:hypothetical protein
MIPFRFTIGYPVRFFKGRETRYYIPTYFASTHLDVGQAFARALQDAGFLSESAS